ncbi:hypothetical protein CXF29_09085, partial [Corynebacterium bovis]|uniref:hypothetical protein n=1 Tax=Corynebacterium bovis TaxID=36808 RepID=UPI000FC15457
RTPDGTALPVGGRGRDRSREERRRALLDRVARWGLPAAMILGGVVSPVAINAFLLASAGMNRRALRLWGGGERGGEHGPRRRRDDGPAAPHLAVSEGRGR